MKRLFLATMLAAVLGFTPFANAGNLTDNGNGLIYEPDINVTWYDQTQSNITWDQAMSYAAGLIVNGVGGWRLPAADVTQPLNLMAGGYGWYGLSGTSEMGRLFSALGLQTGQFPRESTENPFTTLLSSYSYYWTGTEGSSGVAWLYLFNGGYQFADGENMQFFAMAVHDGDVLANGQVLPNGPSVPIPGALLLFAPGLAGLAGIRRRFEK